MERIFKTPLIRLLTLLLASLSALGMFGQVSYYTPFHHSQLNKTDTIAPNNVTYKYLELDADCDGYTNEPGYPMLPVKYVTMSVPYNAYNFSISYGTIRKTSYTLNKKVYPCQTPTVIGDPLVFTAPNDSVYALNDYIHSEVAEIVSEGFIEGENHVVTLAIYPISYNPSENKYWFRWAVNLTVNYSLTADVTSNNSPMKYKPLFRYNQSTAVPSQVHTQSLVVNPTQVNGFAIPDNIRPPLDHNREYWAPVGYEYVVITSDSLAPSFDRLIALKRQKGINAGVVTMTQIYEDPLYVNGDTISNIMDPAGILRAYLTEAFLQGLNYALLCGPSYIVPKRQGYSTSLYAYGHRPDSDLYYSDLTSNWDLNCNGIYGEMRDSLDYYPEIYVGRLLCETPTDVNNYIDKLIVYELNPGNGNTQYLSKSLVYQATPFKLTLDGEQMEHLMNDYFTFDIISENPDIDFPSGKNIIDTLNANNYGFVSFLCHGNPGGLTLKSTGTVYGVTTTDDEDWYHVSENGNGIDCLRNIRFPNIVYSASCDAMPYSNSQQYLLLSRNIGQAFTQGGKYGAAAFLGNTSKGIIRSSFELEKGFLNQIIEGNYNIGKAEAFSKAFGTHDTDTHLVRLSHNLLGDPEISIWSNGVSQYSSLSVNRGDGIITVTSLDNSENIVSLSGPNGIVKSAISGSITFYNCDPNSCVLVYKHNKIPYIAPLMLQNETFSQKYYYIVDTASLGSHVDLNRTVGNYVLSSGADLTIEAFGNVELHPGFVAELGSKLKILTEGEVNIYGGTLNSGAELDITAKKVNFVGRFDVAKGAKINIVKKED